MVKLRELDTEHGTNLARVIRVTNEHADSIDRLQAKTGVKCWERVGNNVPVTEPEADQPADDKVETTQ